MSLSATVHVNARCGLADGSMGYVIFACQSLEACGGRCCVPLMLPPLMGDVNFCWILMDPIVFNGDFKLDSCSDYSCYREIILILLISE